MEELINPKKDHSGPEPKSYIYNGCRIEVLPYFLYEVCLHKYWKNGYCILGSKFIKSDQLLDIKQANVYKRVDEYLLEKDITLLGVPSSFVEENNLPVYEINKIKKKLKRKSK